jgi:hypothetical protein
MPLIFLFVPVVAELLPNFGLRNLCVFARFLSSTFGGFRWLMAVGRVG